MTMYYVQCRKKTFTIIFHTIDEHNTHLQYLQSYSHLETTDIQVRFLYKKS